MPWPQFDWFTRTDHRTLGRDNLPHRTTIEEKSGNSQEPGGVTDFPWVPIFSNVPCRLAPVSQSEAIAAGRELPSALWSLAFEYSRPVKASQRFTVTGTRGDGTVFTKIVYGVGEQNPTPDETEQRILCSEAPVT